MGFGDSIPAKKHIGGNIMASYSLTEAQYNKTRSYIKEARGNFMVALFANIIGAALLTLPAIGDFCLLRTGLRSKSKGSIFVLWCGLLIASICYVLKGFGKKFGPGSDYDLISRSDYECFSFPVAEKLPNPNKAPYIIKDEYGNEYHCISFLDYKYAEAGTEMVGVALSNGKRFAMQQYDASDPYAREQALHC